ncbi:MAG: endolytic transglycosylase MltG [Lachnospiraceae bacterium]|nr:endolytic transglycosylase MltG [Lachnospiraceae bacterium]
MEFKYFLRGLGTGIIFASIIFLIVYSGNNQQKMSDAEIKKRAQELGMEEKDDPIKDLISTTDSKESSGKSSEEESTDIDSSDKGSDTEEEVKEDNTKEIPTEAADDENKSTEETTAQDKAAEVSLKESETKAEEIDIEFSIRKGDTSYPVSLRLKDLGIIDSAEEFDTYLVKHDYANRLRVGDYTLKRGMDYQSIAETISDPF